MNLDLSDCVLGLVGGAGEMGQWFAQELHRDFQEIYLFDKNHEGAIEISKKLKNVEAHDELFDLEKCDVVLVSVPIEVFDDVIEEIRDYLVNCLLIDVCSVKEEPVELMKNSFKDRDDVVCVGSHPLFGPEEPGFRDNNVVLVPVDTKKRKIKNFLEDKGVNVVEMGAEEHDEAMAVVQGLTHLITTSFGKTLGKEKQNIEVNLEDLMTPTFSLLFKDLLRIYRQDPELFASIQTNNPHVEDIGKKFLSNFKEALNYIESKNKTELINFIEKGRQYFKKDL